MVICLERGANDLRVVQLMPLPPRYLLLQQNPEWFILLVPAYPGCPGKEAVKRLCVCVCVMMGDHIQAGKPPRCVTSHLGQLSLLPSTGWKMITGQSAVLL